MCILVSFPSIVPIPTPRIGLFLISSISSAPIEVDVTEGKIEPLPIAITKFNYKSSLEQDVSNKIYEVVTKNLNNSGLFKAIPNEAFLQSSREVFLQPLFSDWRILLPLISAVYIGTNFGKLLLGKISEKIFKTIFKLVLTLIAIRLLISVFLINF